MLCHGIRQRNRLLLASSLLKELFLYCFYYEFGSVSNKFIIIIMLVIMKLQFRTENPNILQAYSETCKTSIMELLCGIN